MMHMCKYLYILNNEMLKYFPLSPEKDKDVCSYHYKMYFYF
jgi:hypothetical protein